MAKFKFNLELEIDMPTVEEAKLIVGKYCEAANGFSNPNTPKMTFRCLEIDDKENIEEANEIWEQWKFKRLN